MEIHEIEEMCSRVGGPIVLVDWYFVSVFIGQSHLLLLTARAGETPTVDYIQTKREDVEGWIQKNLNLPKEDEDPEIAQSYTRSSFDEVCGGLVAPLAERTRPGETLVLCPTEYLHRLPLHALKVGENALIHRNPVVCAYSHSLLRICYLAADYAADSIGPLHPQFISGIAASDDGCYDAGRRSIVDLAKTFNTKSMIDEIALKSRFLREVPTSRLLYIHTHCLWDSAASSDHRLEFPTQEDLSLHPPDRGVTTDSPDQPTSHTLTAREVFDLRCQQGLHVNLIACSGGLTDVKAGDEVMGLVPALLYSGASSTVFTPWPIPDGVGAKFSRTFFEVFRRMMRGVDDHSKEVADGLLEQNRRLADRGGCCEGESAVRWVNIARAFSEAVVRHDPYQNQPLLGWVGFMMHGFWMFPVAKKEGAL